MKCEEVFAEAHAMNTQVKVHRIHEIEYSARVKCLSPRYVEAYRVLAEIMLTLPPYVH